jgi:pilus assembly protein CpaE
MMGIDPEHTFGDLLLAMRNGGGTAKDFLVRHRTGVDILAAPHSADAGPQPTVDEVVQILQKLAETYEFVVVDTPGAFGPLVATALDESALILMTTSADMASIKDTRLSLEILRGAGFDSDKLKLVVNHATNADSVSDQDLSRTVGYDIFWSIPHDREVPISTQHGIPVMVSNPRTKMALKVDALAAYVSGSSTTPDGVALNGYANGSSNGNGHGGRSIIASLFSKGR